MKQAEEATRREAALRLGSRDSSEGESLPHHFAAVVLPWRYPVCVALATSHRKLFS